MQRFYDINTETVFTASQLQRVGIPTNDKEILRLAGKLAIDDSKIPAYLPEVQTYTGTDIWYCPVVDSYIQNYEVVDAASLDTAKTLLKDMVKELRQKYEFGGILIQDTGTSLDSTRADGQMIHNAYIFASELKPDALIDFKAANQWVTLTIDTLRYIFQLQAEHVEQCFTREKQIGELIDAAETVQEAVNIFMSETNNGWPTYVNS